MYGLWRRWDKITTWPIVQVRSTLQMKLNFHDYCNMIRNTMKTRLEKTTWLIVQVWSTSKSELHYHDRLDKMWFILKSRQDNDVIDRIGITFVKCTTELSRPIRQDTIHLEKKTRQWRDRLYRCALRKMRYSTVKTDWIVYGLWWRWDKPTILAIIQVHSMLKMKLNCLIWFYRVWLIV